ncbi:glutathione S-transferase [Aestuariirhabdus sp. Z084]|uniref:glutathione S-transferase n=1 Tax=Aestuariirhabdus haliotis TaxID=2918751 RepID=UPI00201B352A|nr:glutathione S-transferase [Aestuariirhabdus haliotis]MCL6414034.1 glutathione S-transferase [Aestuariirhabdus haliotis]MCL6417967.1 glutathione S-transferase [Aestuariirhabdus haliotis]
MNETNPLPILYSFRRCPYAMRARLALWVSGTSVELREVVLRNKPVELLAISPKATVPVLQLPEGHVIEQSLEIMQWALAQSDPGLWLPERTQQDRVQALVEHNDNDFKYWLDRYKYADRYPERSEQDYRREGERTLEHLDTLLRQQPALSGDAWGLADWAILPFIRQFAHVDREWFYQSPYPALVAWLDRGLESSEFGAVMGKYAPWRPEDAIVMFGSNVAANPIP